LQCWEQVENAALSKTQETANIECSSCGKWFTYYCAGLAAGDKVVGSETTSFLQQPVLLHWQATDKPPSPNPMLPLS